MKTNHSFRLSARNKSRGSAWGSGYRPAAVGAGLFGLGVLILATACGRAPALTAEPSAPDPGTAFCFDVGVDDEVVHLLFALPPETGDGPMRLFHTRSDDAGVNWSGAVPVPADHAPPGRHHRGNDPQLAVAGDRLLAVWTAEGEGPWGSGPLGASVSEDGGLTWSPAPVPVAGEDTGTGYRFPALAADNSGFHAVWIHAVDAERSLRHSRFDFGAEGWTDPVVVDPRMCACCWNRLGVAPDGTLVALYRDIDPSDMGLATSSDRGETWSLRGRVGEFDWFFDGCPHVGGGLALGGDAAGNTRILASVWTGGEGRSGAHVFRSGDSGDTWRRNAAPEAMIQNGRNTDVAMLADRGTVLAWDERAEAGTRAVFAARSGGTEEARDPPQRLSEPGKSATHPRIVAVGGTALVFWTSEDEEGTTRLFWRRLEPRG